MRILVVTSQFPLADEPNRGRPLQQTVRELSKIATVKVVSPVARYPAWARPRSYLFRAADAGYAVEGCDVDYVSYPVLPLVSRPLNGWLCGRAVAPVAAAFAPDVVLAYWLFPDAYAAMLAARTAGVPLVAGARGSDLRVRDAVSRRLTRPVVRSAHRLLVVSEDLGQVAVGDYGADPARIHTIRNGCDAAIFHPRDRDAARAALGVDADAELVVYVGRLVAEKGLRELVESVRSLAARRPRLQLALVGEGPLDDEFAQLLAGEPTLPVRLVGARPAEEVARWMAASDLVTLPSWSEGHPNVLVEALACGRPVVATPVGGIPEIIDPGTGVLVAVKDPGQLERGLEQALERQWDAASLASRFSRDWAQVARDTLRACEEALAASRYGEH